MAYSVNTYSGSRVITVEDGTIDSSLDIRLIGKNYAGYGEVQNTNFVNLLENFAGASEPPRPLNGQLWYDSSKKKIKVYDSATARWKSPSATESSAAQPAGLTTGDLWWDETNHQLYAYDSSMTPSFVLVGPQSVPGLGTTQVRSMSVTDSNGVVRGIIAAYVNGKVMYVVSSESDSYNLSTDSATLLGNSAFGLIKPGITLAYTNNSNGKTDAKAGAPNEQKANFWGTASAAVALVEGDNRFTPADFVKTGNLSFTSIVRFADVGYTLGDSNDLEVKIDSDGITPIIKSATANTIKFQTQTNSPLSLVGANILPGSNYATNLGATNLKFNTLYVGTVESTTLKGNGSAITALNATNLASGIVPAARLSGTYTININGSATSVTGGVDSAVNATNADNLKVGSNYRVASVDTAGTGTANTIAARDANGNLNAVMFQGTATSALFADLAEKYLADQEYEVGTVVSVGGEKEVTACQSGDRAFGAVSANPAFKMNEGLEGGTYIALKGRVPVKVIGPVEKGDKLIAVGDGCCGDAAIYLKNMAIRAGTFPDTFAIALETNDDPGVKLVEAIIL